MTEPEDPSLPPTPEGEGYNRTRPDRLIVAADAANPDPDQWLQIGDYQSGERVYRPNPAWRRAHRPPTGEGSDR